MGSTKQQEVADSEKSQLSDVCFCIRSPVSCLLQMPRLLARNEFWGRPHPGTSEPAPALLERRLYVGDFLASSHMRGQPGYSEVVYFENCLNRGFDCIISLTSNSPLLSLSRLSNPASIKFIHSCFEILPFLSASIRSNNCLTYPHLHSPKRLRRWNQVAGASLCEKTHRCPD